MGIGKPTKRAELPWSARDVLALSGLDAILHGAVVAFADVTGIWRYPIRCRGDFAEMRFLDHAYWIYKAGRPIRRARRGSGLEEFFARQSALRAELPSGFRGDRELTLSACGDLMSHTYLADSKDELYAAVSDLIFDADISTANLECVVDPPVEKELAISLHTAPSLYYDEHAFAAARGASKRFTFLAGACNHSLDFGEVGVDRTIRALDDAGIAFAGLTRRDDDPFRATIIERRGFRIGRICVKAKPESSKRPSRADRKS